MGLFGFVLYSGGQLQQFTTAAASIGLMGKRISLLEESAVSSARVGDRVAALEALTARLLEQAKDHLRGGDWQREDRRLSEHLENLWVEVRELRRRTEECTLNGTK